jgi:hypothetical protein
MGLLYVPPHATTSVERCIKSEGLHEEENPEWSQWIGRSRFSAKKFYAQVSRIVRMVEERWFESRVSSQPRIRQQRDGLPSGLLIRCQFGNSRGNIQSPGPDMFHLISCLGSGP